MGGGTSLVLVLMLVTRSVRELFQYTFKVLGGVGRRICKLHAQGLGVIFIKP